MSVDCPTCLAAEHSTDLTQLVRWQAVHLEQARDAVFPLQVELGRARDRIRELEEIVKRQNRRLAMGRTA